MRQPNQWTNNPISLEDRVWGRVVKGDGCWLRNHSVTSRGYSMVSKVRTDGKSSSVGAHRLAWILTFGPVPEGMVVRHKCDRPNCVRPDHLELGTQSDNARDRIHRGRDSVSRLNMVSAEAIRAMYITGKFSQTDLARQFEVSTATVWSVLHN